MANNIKIDIKNKGKLLANASVLIETTEYGKLNVKAFQIWQSNHLNTRLGEYINIAPPSLRYFNFVFFENDKEWFKLEKQIWESYQNKIANDTPVNLDEVDAMFNNP